MNYRHFQGSIGYVPQVAAVFNATLRDNILFGKEYDPGLYRRVLDACDLIKDIATLPAGDMTEIGERVSEFLFFLNNAEKALPRCLNGKLGNNFPK
ncbi:hypothetical protein HPB48_019942 [Haemaphysalis longicornis]|uniref:Uncharacterized protein n=1 Tax=Haemaphysalis longicornis TaxID=44386 RepID=A0A9J6G9K6_HAELO|nr:hypothetical protein HPB48_019942 [Haemaphysalis longicornis]